MIYSTEVEVDQAVLRNSFFKNNSMQQKRLELYYVDLKYIRNLAHADDNVFSISPQIGKNNRPFIGIIIICEGKHYCVPLSSPKEKHKKMKNDKDFMKIFDSAGKLIGVLNFNNMVPVRDHVIQRIDINVHKNDNVSVARYKNLLIDQIRFCRQNHDAIIQKAIKLYVLITSGKPEKNLRRRCCDYKKLELILSKYKIS